MRYYWLVLGILATWRVTHLVQAEDGPARVFLRLRGLAGPGWSGELLRCFYCLSLWISVPFALWLGETWKERFLLWLALSGSAILLERITNRDLSLPAQYTEEKEVDHDLLR